MDFSFCQDRLSKMLNTSILVILWFMHVCGGIPSGHNGIRCTSDEVYIAGNSTHCSRQYLRCEDGVWNRAVCAGGYFKDDMKECVPFSDDCQHYLDIEDRSLLVTRHKRQTTEMDCDHSYLCPTDVVQEYIYPDWDNENCDTFYKCYKGQLKLHSCKTGIYHYYNPRTFSCEEHASLTNTCIRRIRTRLGPIL